MLFLLLVGSTFPLPLLPFEKAINQSLQELQDSMTKELQDCHQNMLKAFASMETHMIIVAKEQCDWLCCAQACNHDVVQQAQQATELVLNHMKQA